MHGLVRFVCDPPHKTTRSRAATTRVHVKFNYLHEADDYCARTRTNVAAGRPEYVGHVKYHHVYTAHLLEKHAPDADQQRFAIDLVGQHFRHRVTLRLLLFDERLWKTTRFLILNTRDTSDAL